MLFLDLNKQKGPPMNDINKMMFAQMGIFDEICGK